jgi:hypothetical protein
MGFGLRKRGRRLCTPTQLIHTHKLYHRQVYEMLATSPHGCTESILLSLVHTQNPAQFHTPG